MSVQIPELKTDPAKSRSSLAPMRHRLFRAVWISSSRVEFRRADPVGRRRVADGVDCAVRRDGRAGADVDDAADHVLLARSRRHRGQLRSPLDHARRAGVHARRLGVAHDHDRPVAAHAMDAARLYLPDRLRRGAERACVAGLGRRDGAARGSARRCRAESDGLQRRAQRRSGARRHHRRGRGHRRRLSR